MFPNLGPLEMMMVMGIAVLLFGKPLPSFFSRYVFGSSSKMNAEWAFLTVLRDLGQRSAEAFLDAHGADVGQRSSYDVDDLLMGV